MFAFTNFRSNEAMLRGCTSMRSNHLTHPRNERSIRRRAAILLEYYLPDPISFGRRDNHRKTVTGQGGRGRPGCKAGEIWGSPDPARAGDYVRLYSRWSPTSKRPFRPGERYKKRNRGKGKSHNHCSGGRGLFITMGPSRRLRRWRTRQSSMPFPPMPLLFGSRVVQLCLFRLPVSYCAFHPVATVISHLFSSTRAFRVRSRFRWFIVRLDLPSYRPLNAAVIPSP